MGGQCGGLLLMALVRAWCGIGTAFGLGDYGLGVGGSDRVLCFWP